MRIAIVTNRYPVDAADTASPFVADFCRALERLGHQLHVVTPFYPPERPERDPWVERFRWVDSDKVLGQLPLRTVSGLTTAFKAFTAGRRAVMDAVAAFKPDYILALWALPSGWWAQAAAKRFSIPYGVWCLGSDIQLWGRRPIARSLIKRILRHSSHLYADGYALAEETARLARKPCTFLPSMRELSYSETSMPDHPFNGDPYFIYFGRLAADKGVLDLLAAAEWARDHCPATIVFAGTPDPGLDIDAEIKKRGLESLCRFVGPLGPRDIQRYLSHARAVLLPSRRDSIPLVFGEAMQCRTPVLCSNLPDFRAVLQRYAVGTIASHQAPRVWAEALRDFTPDVASSDEMARFCEDFSAAKAAERFSADISHAVSQPQPPAAEPVARERSYA